MKRFLTSLLILASVLSASAWSSKGHQITAYMAKRHLSTEASAALDDLLDGSSIVYYASWMDQVKSNPEYAYTSVWHYLNVDPWETYETRNSLSGIDAATALYAQSDVLKSELSTREEKQLAAKVLIHVVGDMHQPLHCGHKCDTGGNTIKLTYKGNSTNLHSIWDYNIVNDAHLWGYYDWVVTLDHFTDEEIEQLTAGTIDDWAKESVALAALIYDWFPKGCNVTQDDVEEWTPEIEMQLCKGGLRLARLFNDIFASRPTTVEGLEAEDGVPERYFTLQGVEVRATEGVKLPRGLYITTRGKKVVVK